MRTSSDLWPVVRDRGVGGSLFAYKEVEGKSVNIKKDLLTKILLNFPL